MMGKGGIEIFVTGLVVSYVLLFLILFCGKYIGQRFDKCISKAQEMFCAFIFTMVTYLMTLLYTCLTEYSPLKKLEFRNNGNQCSGTRKPGDLA